MRDISLSLPSVGEFSISEVRVGFFAMSLVYFMCMALLKMIELHVILMMNISTLEFINVEHLDLGFMPSV